jgi:2-polyprenyl-3-methyl-5-hydroxy-6-metoxy-1,4-benzoquinol methylase
MEFDKYDKFGAYHWSEFIQGSGYREHAVKVKRWVEEKDVLDVGCGDGLLTYLMGAEGIDPSETGIRLAQEKGVTCHIGDVYDLSNERNYEAVFMGDVLEHLELPDMAIDEISRHTKILYIVTPKNNGIKHEYHYHEYEPDELNCFMADKGWKRKSFEIIGDRMYGRYILKPQEA